MYYFFFFFVHFSTEKEETSVTMSQGEGSHPETSGTTNPSSKRKKIV